MFHSCHCAVCNQAMWWPAVHFSHYGPSQSIPHQRQQTRTHTESGMDSKTNETLCFVSSKADGTDEHKEPKDREEDTISCGECCVGSTS